MTAQAPGFPLPEALQALLASPEDCIKLLDRDARILNVNAGGVRLMEAECREAIVGRDWIAFWQGHERDAVRSAFALALGGDVARARGSAPTFKNTPKVWDNLLVPVPDPDGKVPRVLAITRDVTAFHEAVRLLGLEQRRSDALIRAVSQIVWRSSRDQRIVGREDWLRFCGAAEDGAVSFHWLSAVHPDDRDAVQARVDACVALGHAYAITYRLRHRSGTWRWVEDRAVPVRDEAGSLTEWVGLIVDVHDRVESEAALRASEERLQLAVAASGLGIWDQDLATGAVRWSPTVAALLGLPADHEPSEELLFACVHPDDRRDLRRLFQAETPTLAPAPTARFRVVRADTGAVRWMAATGSVLADASGRAARRIGTWQDLTDAVTVQHDLWRAANHDPLTGLANRTLFSGLLAAATEAATTAGTPFAVLLIDLDDFKTVNDTLGHGVGDLVLVEVATRLRQVCPPGATVARLGGDEFAVLLDREPSDRSAAREAERLAAALRDPIAYADGVVHCAASVGVAVCPAERCPPADALRNADLALFESKRAGLGRPAIFTADLASLLLQRATSLRLIEDALARGAVAPFYQPKIALATGRIDGFEALLRWNDGQRWQLPASVAEAFDHPVLAARLGERMLDLVIADLLRWGALNLDVGRIAVNVAAVEFATTDVAERLLGRLAAAGLSTAALELEVTESVVLGAQAVTVGPALRRLHERGLSIALDDFGTGFASLTHLRQHPFDWLKIERSFVSDMAADEDAAAIVSAVIGLAHALRRRVVAEGVETAAQLQALRAGGCDVIQGHLVAKPMPASRVPHFVRTWAGLGSKAEVAMPIAS